MSFEVEYFTLDSTDASNAFLNLSGVPADASNTAMDIIGGTAQLRCFTPSSGCDFAVDGTRIRWDDSSYGLYGLLGTGDKVRIIYDRS